MGLEDRTGTSDKNVKYKNVPLIANIFNAWSNFPAKSHLHEKDFYSDTNF